jgi:hypothetical protein
VCLDQIRPAGRKSPGEELNGTVPEPTNGNGHTDANDPGEVLERLARLEQIRIHLARLPEQHRIALVLREVEGMGHREIATVLHTTPPKVKALLHRARKGFQRTWGDGERSLGIFLPLTAAFGWLRRIFGRVHDLGASGVAASPTVTTVATTGDHLSTAVAAVVLAGSIGLASVGAPPRQVDSAPAPGTVQVEAATATAPGMLPDEHRQQRPRAAATTDETSATAPAEDAAPAPEGATAGTATQQKPEDEVLPEPAPEQTVRPEPATPPGFTFVFSSDWIGAGPCGCADSPEVTDQQTTSAEGELTSFSSRIQGGVLRDSGGQPAWPVDIVQSGGPNDHTLEFVVHTADGDHSYAASGTQVSRTRTSWGGWTYTFAGSYQMTDGPEGTTLPRRGNYSASLTFALREGRLVDASLALSNGEYGG